MAGPLQKKGAETASKKSVQLPVKFEPRFLDDADSRIAVVRNIRKRVELLKEHTGADSCQREMLCLHAAFMHTRLETMEVEALEGQPLDWGEFTQAVNCLNGLLSKLGLEKRMKSVGGLKQYLEQRNGK